ncbi:ADP-glyceromanno-heptose 6-epimerase [Flavobacteriales bacterium]|nr:ADP-glyceromanno-heptose 6-epimerase [Flavobacteriales bacterium]
MITITGAAGFIGSALAARLNAEGFNDLVLVDDFDSRPDKGRNHADRTTVERVDRAHFPAWLKANENQVQFVFHLGARTDTTEQDRELFDRLNLNYSKEIWTLCHQFGLPLVYASSAATYGGGEHGYSDAHKTVGQLRPLNPYGDSKQAFDIWALAEADAGRAPYFWAGLKFFNVYGPGEYHKGRMASVVMHAFRQIGETQAMKLFRSHRDDYADGEQLRDFVYVRDVVDVCHWLMHHRKDSGIYNLGSGQARSFLDLTKATFAAMDVPENIGFIDTPADIRDTYQYFTEADLSKLRSIGYDREMTSLEAGVTEYVRDFLLADRTL